MGEGLYRAGVGVSGFHHHLLTIPDDEQSGVSAENARDDQTQGVPLLLLHFLIPQTSKKNQKCPWPLTKHDFLAVKLCWGKWWRPREEGLCNWLKCYVCWDLLETSLGNEWKSWSDHISAPYQWDAALLPLETLLTWDRIPPSIGGSTFFPEALHFTVMEWPDLSLP